MNILLTDSYTHLLFVVSDERISQKEVFSQRVSEENTGILVMNISDWSVHSYAQQNRVWLFIMRSAVKTHLYLAQHQPANADLNLAADDMHWMF